MKGISKLLKNWYIILMKLNQLNISQNLFLPLIKLGEVNN